MTAGRNSGLYGQRWKNSRAKFLREHPLCIECHRWNMVTAATVVDHIKPHRGDVDLFWDKANWQPLCKACHDSYKQRVEKTGEYGCDANGFPLSASHHWR